MTSPLLHPAPATVHSADDQAPAYRRGAWDAWLRGRVGAVHADEGLRLLVPMTGADPGRRRASRCGCTPWARSSCSTEPARYSRSSAASSHSRLEVVLLGGQRVQLPAEARRAARSPARGGAPAR